MANNTVIVSRIQNRRGLKQDLPQPLRAGEIGLATDSRQVYIGADASSEAGKQLTFEKTLNAQDMVESIYNNQIIKFSLPTKSLLGVPAAGDRQLSYNSNSSVFDSTVTTYHNIGTLLPFKSTDITVTKNSKVLVGDNSIEAKLDPSSINYIANASAIPDNIASDKDYFFSASKDTSNAHVIYFRSPLESTDDIRITYYDKNGVLQTLDGDPDTPSSNLIISTDVQENFYEAENIPTFRKLSENNIVVSSTTGTGFIGLNHKHIAVTADSVADMTDPSTVTLSNLFISRSDKISTDTYSSDGSTVTLNYDNSAIDYNASSNLNFVYVTGTGDSNIDGNHYELSSSNTTTLVFSATSSVVSNANITHGPIHSVDLSSASNVTAAITIVDNLQGSYDWFQLKYLPDSSNQKVYVTHKPAYSSVPLNFRLHEDGTTLNELQLAQQEYTSNTTVRAKLERFLNTNLNQANINVYTDISVGSTLSDSGVSEVTTLAYTDFLDATDSANKYLYFNSKEEASAFSDLVNRLYFEYSTYTNTALSIAKDTRGLLTLNTNLELLTKTAAATLDKVSTFDEPESVGIASGGTKDIQFDISTYGAYFLDYVVSYGSSAPIKAYTKVGTLNLTGYNVAGGNNNVAFQDVGSDVGDNETGNVSFDASISNNIVTVTATSTLGEPATLKYIMRRIKTST